MAHPSSDSSPATPSQTPDASQTGLRGKATALVESDRFQKIIMTIIILNAVTLGLETSETIMAIGDGRLGSLLHIMDKSVLGVFVIEILLKLYAYRLTFFRNGWNLFDFLIVTISLIPASETLSVLRALRILRALRLFSMVPALRRVVEAFLSALPGMGAVVGVLGLVYYISAVMATKLFAKSFPDWFGTVGESMYSLFQIMTLESWSMGIVRPVMEVYPQSWLFFLPFIMLTSFAILNLFIGIIVDAMQSLNAAEREIETQEIREIASEETHIILKELKELREEVKALRQNQ